MDPELEPNPIPPEPEPPGTGHILDLSDELLLKIVSYSGKPPTITDDLVNLSQSCTRFDTLLQDGSICRRVKVLWNIYMERCHLVRYLTQPIRAEIMTELNLNDFYWIPSGELKDLVLKLSNLQGLHACGTLLNFEDLLEILLRLTLRDLSWTWKIGRATDESNYDFFKSNELSGKLSQLRKLCLFIPPIFKMGEHRDIIPHLSICYFLSLCVGLEKLWLFSCAEGDPELDRLIHFGTGQLELIFSYTPTPDIEFPNLVDFVYSFPRRSQPKLCVPKLVSRILQGFTLIEVLEAGNEQEISPVPVPEPMKPKQLWIEHPYLISHCKNANSLNFNRPGWPQMDLSNLESISFPIYHQVINGLFPNNVVADLSKCKHIQITDTEGRNDRVNLNGYFESAVNLESFLSKATNYELDWNAFVKSHPKITLINVDKVENQAYPEFCVALSKLAKLKRISVPYDVLDEIPEFDANAVQEFRILVSSVGADLSYSTSRPTGLDFLTLGCRDVEEFEIGMSGWSPLTNNVISDSLTSISLWTNLKKLTLSLGGISHGGFLIEIAKSCPLEILRLSIHNEDEECSYMENLCEALRFCQHLKDFRWEEEHPGVSHTQIFPALQFCKNLERVVIKSKFSYINRAYVVELMNICTKLSVLYLLLQNATKAACNALRMELESMFKDSRPSLSIAIRNTYDYSPVLEFEYPAIHYRQMVVFSTQVEPNYDYTEKFV